MTTIQCDTREKLNKKEHILDHFANAGIKVVRSKLFVGDYTLLHKQDVVVDVKQDIVELIGNLSGEHKRFSSECARATANNIKLVILTEQELPQGGLPNWKSPVYKSTTKTHKKGDPITRFNPLTASKIIDTMSRKYNVEFSFCSKDETGKKIIEILGGDTH